MSTSLATKSPYSLRLDFARHHALRQRRTQDHLVLRRQRSGSAHSWTACLYYTEMAEQFGGMDAAQNFSRFYPVPNMDHCTGGATTDGFDFLTPLVNWVEKATPPAGVPASGTNFNAATYQVVGNYITGTFVNAPTTRSRLLCPYPQQARFTGKVSLVNGVPVASNPSDLASAANYACINFVQTASHDFNGTGESDVLWRDKVEQHRHVADERHEFCRPTRLATWEPAGRPSASATSTATVMPTFCGGIPAAMSASG